MKPALIAIFLTLSASSAFAGMLIPGTWIMNNLGTEDVAAGTVCQVKDITVLTQTAEDCATIGGEATHTLTQTAVPVAK